MRRPLLCVVLIYTAVLYLILRFCPPSCPSFEQLDEKTVTVSGTVEEKEYKLAGDGSLSLLVTLRYVKLNPKGVNSAETGIKGADHSAALQDAYSGRYNVRGKVLVRITSDPQQAYEKLPIGVQTSVRGELSAPQTPSNDGAFDSSLYHRILNISFEIRKASVQNVSGHRDPLRDLLSRIRMGAADILDRSLPKEDAGVMKAMLLGEKGFLSEDIKALYQGGGIIHVLAISGLHISIIGMGLYNLLRRIRRMPRLVCTLSAVIVMLLYGMMTGMSASAVRALIMFVLRLCSVHLHRTYDLPTAAAVAGFLLLIQQPLLLFYSGFLFSFGAVLSIGLIGPVLPGRHLKKISVFFLTFPVYLSTYYSFPLLSVVLNLIVLPLAGSVLLSGIFVILTGLFGTALSQLCGVAAHVLLYFYHAVCGLSGYAGYGKITFGAPSEWQILLYLVMLLILVLAENKEPDAVKALWLLASCMVLTMPMHRGLDIHVLDVGQGDGIILQTPAVSVLIDGGSADQQQIARYCDEPALSYYGIGRPDLIIITHEDEDHCGGLLQMLEEGTMSAGQILLPDIAESSKGDNYHRIEYLAKLRGIPVGYLHRFQTIRAGRLQMSCLGPDAGAEYGSANEGSVVLYLQYGKFSALLTGDLEGEGEKELIRNLEGNSGALSRLPVTWLKVAHHGSRGATSDEFLSRISCRFATISCGEDNRYGHPHRQLLQRLENHQIPYLVTDEEDEISIHTDGSRFGISLFRRSYKKRWPQSAAIIY